MPLSEISPHPIVDFDLVRLGYSVAASKWALNDRALIRNFFNHCKSGDIPCHKQWTHKSTGWRYADVACDESERFTVGHGYAPKETVTFQFNLRKLGPSGRLALKCTVDDCLIGGWAALVANGNFIKAEIACDVPGVEYFDYYYMDAHVRSGKYMYETLGTTYLGSPRSARQIVCYRKTAQLLHAGAAAAGGQLLRIEARLTRNQMLVEQLLSIKNPFLPVLLVSRRSVSDSNSCIAFGRFRHLVRQQHYPAQRALEQVAAEDKRDRPLLVNALRALAPPWWSPAEVWSHVPAALHSLVNLDGALSAP
jgi:hypothetical protein